MKVFGNLSGVFAMEIVVLTCILGLLNVVGVSSASDQHLDSVGMTAQQLNAVAENEPNRRGSLIEVIGIYEDASADQQNDKKSVTDYGLAQINE